MSGSPLTLDGKRYRSAKEAAEGTGYTSDYIARLCRSGEVAGRVVGRTWYVEEDSLLRFLAEKNRKKIAARRELSEARRSEYRGGGDRPVFVPFEAIEKAGALLAAVVIVFGLYHGSGTLAALGSRGAALLKEGERSLSSLSEAVETVDVGRRIVARELSAASVEGAEELRFALTEAAKDVSAGVKDVAATIARGFREVFLPSSSK